MDEIIELIRQMDFPLSRCQTIVATHADADHVQGLAKAKQTVEDDRHGASAGGAAAGDRRSAEDLRRDRGAGHPSGNAPVESRPARSTRAIGCASGQLQLDVWHTPGHTDSQLAFRLGSFCSAVTTSTATAAWGPLMPITAAIFQRLSARCSEFKRAMSQWLLPSHGPIFRKDDQLLAATIARLRGLPAHGRFRHLRHRLAVDGRVGRRIGVRSAAGINTAVYLTCRAGAFLYRSCCFCRMFLRGSADQNPLRAPGGGLSRARVRRDAGVAEQLKGGCP